MSVQRRDRHLAQPSLTPFCYLLLHRVSVQRRDRRTVIIFPCEFLRSHSVSVQRRDRSLFFLLHCSTKVRYYQFALICLVIVALFQDFFSQPFLQCVCPKTWQVLCSFFDLSQDPFYFPLLSSVFTVCLSKDVTGALLPTPLTPLFFPFPPPPFLFVFSYLVCEPFGETAFSFPRLLFGFSLSALRVYLSKDVAGTPPFPNLILSNLSYLSHTNPLLLRRQSQNV